MLTRNSRQIFSNKIALSTVDGHMGKEKSKSTEFLGKCQSFYLDTCSIASARAHSTWDLSSGESCDIDKPMENNMLPRTRTRSSTKRRVIPFSVKYAVSPTHKVDHSGVEGMDMKSSSSKLSGTDLLDQTLNCIKAKLNMLQNERVEMDNKMTHIMEDIQSALAQAHHTPMPKGCRVYTKSELSEGSVNKQEKSSRQTSVPAQDINLPSATAPRDLSPTNSPTSFNRRGSIRQKLTSAILSQTQFIWQATTSSKLSTLPTPSISIDSVCKVNQKKLFRTSMPPECSIICTIPEDSKEAINQYTTHHKPCDKTEERLLSSRNTVIRRSSLTGQLEQCHKLPAQSRDDSNIKIRDRSDRVQAIERRKKAASMFTHKIITATQHTSKLSVDVILLPSTETTV